MSESETQAPRRMEEDETGRLLRAAGPRARVSTARAERVRSNLRAAWHVQQRRRVARRRLVLVAAAATIAVATLVGTRSILLDRSVTPVGDPIAVVELVHGAVSGLQRADGVAVGRWIATGSQSRIALRFGRDVSVRLDSESRMRALSPGVIELASGAVYVDTGEERSTLEIRTALGTARDIGTQFEVRLVDDALRLRVRTGVVELSDRARAISARPGTQVTLSPAGAVTQAIASHGPEWAWISSVSPPIEMEGVPLAAFLDRVAREQGWTVEYRDPELEQRARTIILHGTVEHLDSHEAVDVAIATSGLRHRLEGGSLVVFAADSPSTGAADRQR